MGLLDGKVAIITGAGGGLGRAYALLFAENGARVVVNDLGGAMDGSGEGTRMADAVVNEIREAGGEAIANYASVSDPEGAESIVSDAIEAFGALDIVVNNAGILRDKTLLKLSIEHFDIVMAVHARGTFLVTKAAAAKMRELGNQGTIINTSSIAGLKGNFGQTNYACAKAGIAGMTRVWSQELLRHDIRCNAIAPMAKTRMTEDIDAVSEDILPEHIAPMVLYLASDLSKDVNGRIFGCHGRHLFEYHMQLSPGVELERPLWTAQEIHERLSEISELPSAKPPATSSAQADERSVEDMCNEVFENMATVFVPEKAGSWTTVIHFEIVGTGSWGVTVENGSCSSSPGKPEGTRCTITYDSSDTLLASVSGKLNPQQAFMAGKIKADNMGDLMKFAQCFDMKKAAAIAKKRAGGGDTPSIHSQVDEVFSRMPSLFVPEKAGTWASVIHFEIGGTGSYTVAVGEGQCETSKGKPDNARCNIVYDSAETLLGSVTGKLNPQQAFMSGKIKADNMGDLMKFAQCFDMRKATEIAQKSSSEADDSSSKEGMNRELIGKTVRMAAEFVYPTHTQGYASATNDTNDAYGEGNGSIAPPIFAVRPFMKALGEAVMDPELNANLMRLVHGEQDMVFHNVLKPWDLVATRASIVDIETKSSGELLKVRQRLMRDGEIICETISGFFVRNRTKSDGQKKAAAPEAETRGELLFESTFTVDDDQSYRYAEASLDKNPIHVDDNAARAAGHPGVIMHGLCTMAMTSREIVNQLCDADPTRLQRLKVRFTRVVLPGDTLTTRAWKMTNENGVQTVGLETVNQKGETVIGNALAEIRTA